VDCSETFNVNFEEVVKYIVTCFLSLSETLAKAGNGNRENR
jgi:hypothetical protein